MTNEEIKLIMSKPVSSKYIPQYREIYKLATGKAWTRCMCGNNLQILYNDCKRYAERLK